MIPVKTQQAQIYTLSSRQRWALLRKTRPSVYCQHDIRVLGEISSKETTRNGTSTHHSFICELMLFAALAHESHDQCGTSWGLSWGISVRPSSFFLFAGAALSGERKSLAMRLAVGAAKRRRCSTTWPTSCLCPTASALTWTRPPSWGSPSASCAHASCSPPVRPGNPHIRLLSDYSISKRSIEQQNPFLFSFFQTDGDRNCWVASYLLAPSSQHI